MCRRTLLGIAVEWIMSKVRFRADIYSKCLGLHLNWAVCQQAATLFIAHTKEKKS